MQRNNRVVIHGRRWVRRLRNVIRIGGIPEVLSRWSSGRSIAAALMVLGYLLNVPLLSAAPFQSSGLVGENGLRTRPAPLSGRSEVMPNSTSELPPSTERPISPPGSEVDAGDSSRQVWPTFIWLAVILTAFVWGARWWRSRDSAGGPGTANAMVETLIQVPLDGRHRIQLVRVGQRILVLGVSAESIQTLSEITDPDELALLLQGSRNSTGRTSSGFADLLRRYQGHRPPQSNSAADESPSELLLAARQRERAGARSDSQRAAAAGDALT